MITLQKHKVRVREFRGPNPGNVMIAGRNPNSMTAERIIDDLKKETEYRVQSEQEVKEMEKAKLRGKWEAQSTKRMVQAATYRKFSSIKQEMMDNIEDRREKLRQLIAKEYSEYATESDHSYETITERQAKLREKARRLKDEKALDNEQIAAEKYNRLWRDQCEELRTVLSRRTAHQIRQDNEEIIQRKQYEQEADKQYQDEYFTRLWYEEIRKKEEREKRDEEAAELRNQDQLKILLEQKALVAERKQKEKDLKEEEQRLRLEMLELKKLEQTNDYEIKLRKQKELRDQFDENVRLKMKRLNRLRQEELAFDTTLMEQLLSASESDSSIAWEKKMKLKEESQKYRDYLHQLKLQEEAREKELDTMMNEEIAKQWQKRLDQWDREAAARKKLLQEVIEIRRQQVQDKMTRNHQEQESLREERVKFAELIEQYKQEEQDKKQVRRDKDRNYRNDLKGQIQYNQHHRDLARKEFLHEQEQMWEEEREFKRRIEATLSEDWIDPHAHPWRKQMITEKQFHSAANPTRQASLS